MPIRKLGLASFGAAAFLAGMVSLASAKEEVRTFGNWLVGCDNANVCMAIVFAEPSKAIAELGIPLLQIRHHPLRDATPEIRIVDSGPSGEGDRLAKSRALLVVTPTGAEIAKGPASHRAEFEGNAGFRFQSSRARIILHALRSRTDRITISIDEKQNLRVNTAGLEAALAYMDDQQELADKPGALVRKPDGVLNDYLHPIPPDVETVGGAAFGEPSDSGIPRRNLLAVPGCKPLQTDGTAQGYALRGSAILLRGDCAGDGQNQLSAWYLLPSINGRAGPHLWSNGTDGKRRDGALLANVEVLPNGGIIRATRFRAATRDCGIHERWGWIGEGRFELIERREMPLCRTAGPARWIITYRANFISPLGHHAHPHRERPMDRSFKQPPHPQCADG
ncbi:MAG: DUF1176 domain-containing protein [Bosea sp. (in: a-proteobacteria)]|jgi:hypothetical protein